MSTSNFALVLKKEWIERRKALITGVIAIWGGYIVLALLLGLIGIGGGAGTFIFYFFVGIICCIISSSFSFSSMKEKPGRIATLTLPATVGAKYWSRLLIMGPCLLIAIIMGSYIGDGVRILVTYWQYGYWSHFFSIESIEGLVQVNPYIMFFSSYLFYQALFFWGSTMWPRYSFIKTMLVFAIFETILSTITIIYCVSHTNYFVEAMQDPDHSIAMYNKLNLMGNASIYINIAVALGLYIWAYYRFKRDNVVYKLF